MHHIFFFFSILGQTQNGKKSYFGFTSTLLRQLLIKKKYEPTANRTRDHRDHASGQKGVRHPYEYWKKMLAKSYNTHQPRICV